MKRTIGACLVLLWVGTAHAHVPSECSAMIGEIADWGDAQNGYMEDAQLTTMAGEVLLEGLRQGTVGADRVEEALAIWVSWATDVQTSNGALYQTLVRFLKCMQ